MLCRNKINYQNNESNYQKYHRPFGILGIETNFTVGIQMVIISFNQQGERNSFFSLLC